MKPATVIIARGNVWGHQYAATILADGIKRVFGVAVEMASREDDLFEVRVKDVSIYKHRGEMRSFDVCETILADMRQYLDPINPPAPDASPSGAGDKAEERIWMQCLCSGE